jgi:lipoprotein NlpD
MTIDRSTQSLEAMLRSLIVGACAALALTACVVSATHEAPIVERSQVGRPPEKVAPAAQPAPAASAPAREAHDGQYVVQAGDTLYSIALAFGRDFRDIARWNGLDDEGHLQVGQTLRVVAPADEAIIPAQASPIAISPSTKLETRPLAPGDLIAAPAPTPSPAPAYVAPDQTAAMPAPAAAAPTTDNKAAAGETGSVWVWPSSGKLLGRFDETRNKGIDIAGSVGDPVWAASDGEVVYSGSSLPGYGKLVIIKHTDDYVSAYAHNNEILVTQGQTVKRGQRIADLGMTDASSPRLHFEIRRRGTPVDPLAYLPLR